MEIGRSPFISLSLSSSTCVCVCVTGRAREHVEVCVGEFARERGRGRFMCHPQNKARDRMCRLQRVMRRFSAGLVK